MEPAVSTAELLALRPGWDELWQAAGGRYQDSSEFAALSWDHVAGPGGAELFCAVARRDGAPAVIWPLTVHRRSGLRFLRPLGPGAADDTAILVRPGAEDLLPGVFAEVLAASRADVVQLPYLVAGSALHRLGTGTGRVVSEVPDRVPVARLRGEDDWDAYRGGSARKSLAKRLRRLAREGAVERREAADGEVPALVDWFLEQRRRRGEVTGRSGEWLRDPGYRAFLVASLTGSALTRTFLLEFDGRPVSMVTAGAGTTVAHTGITAFDPAFGAHSPGLLAFEQCGRWALEHGLDLNMGPGGEDFKTHLARGNVVPTASLQLALTRRARLATGARDLLARVRG